MSNTKPPPLNAIKESAGNVFSMCGDSRITIERINKKDLLAIVTQVIKPIVMPHATNDGFHFALKKF